MNKDLHEKFTIKCNKCGEEKFVTVCVGISPKTNNGLLHIQCGKCMSNVEVLQ